MPKLTARMALLLGCTGCIWVTDAEHQARLEQLDADDDGYLALGAGGLDCDDSDPDVNPDAVERCETPYDDNCDGIANGDGSAGASTYYLDSDGDGYGDPSATVQACQPPDESYIERGGDCNDEDDDINPGAVQFCPGLGLEDLDCDDEPRPCTAPADALVPVLAASDAGSFFVDEGRVFERTSTGLYLWEDGDLHQDRSSRSGAESLFTDAGRTSPVDVAGSWVAVGLELDDGEVQWLDLRGGRDSSGTLVSPSSRSRQFGVGLAWRDAGDLAVLDRVPGPRPELIEFDLRDPGSSSEPRSIPAVRLSGGGATGDRLIMAVDPGEGPDGSLTVLGLAPRDDARIQGTGLGSQATALADLDGDGRTDVLAATDTTLYAWKGPISGDRTPADAWWTLSLPGAARSLHVTDLSSDGKMDLIVGLPGLSGGGEAHVYTDIGRGPTGPWAVLGPGSTGFGTSVGAARVYIGGSLEPVVLVGDTASSTIVALPWR